MIYTDFPALKESLLRRLRIIKKDLWSSLICVDKEPGEDFEIIMSAERSDL
jgi:hypothetical protein